MEKDTMYWLFTTAPQAIAALVGIIFTGMFFMAESIDNRVRADQSLTEIAEAAKTALYKNLRLKCGNLRGKHGNLRGKCGNLRG